MNIIAKRVRKLENHKAEQYLWELSSEVIWNAYRKDWEEDFVPKKTKFVITSAVSLDIYGPETYMFPADENGKIISYSEMPGSFKGGLDHDICIRTAGWEISR